MKVPSFWWSPRIPAASFGVALDRSSSYGPLWVADISSRQFHSMYVVRNVLTEANIGSIRLVIEADQGRKSLIYKDVDFPK